eukprot:2183972-Pyramimonas_sp.AAC.1
MERLPVIGLDLAFFKGEAADADVAGPRAEDGQRQDEEVVLVADADTGATRSVPKPDRRADPYTVAATVAFIRSFSIGRSS